MNGCVPKDVFLVRMAKKATPHFKLAECTRSMPLINIVLSDIGTTPKC